MYRPIDGPASPLAPTDPPRPAPPVEVPRGPGDRPSAPHPATSSRDGSPDGRWWCRWCGRGAAATARTPSPATHIIAHASRLRRVPIGPGDAPRHPSAARTAREACRRSTGGPSREACRRSTRGPAREACTRSMRACRPLRPISSARRAPRRPSGGNPRAPAAEPARRLVSGVEGCASRTARLPRERAACVSGPRLQRACGTARGTARGRRERLARRLLVQRSTLTPRNVHLLQHEAARRRSITTLYLDFRDQLGGIIA
jgi:hypothetical protein